MAAASPPALRGRRRSGARRTAASGRSRRRVELNLLRVERSGSARRERGCARQVEADLAARVALLSPERVVGIASVGHSSLTLPAIGTARSPPVNRARPRFGSWTGSGGSPGARMGRRRVRGRRPPRRDAAQHRPHDGRFRLPVAACPRARIEAGLRGRVCGSLRRGGRRAGPVVADRSGLRARARGDARRARSGDLVRPDDFVSLPVDYRECRNRSCADSIRHGSLEHTQTGLEPTVFTHVIDCRDPEAGRRRLRLLASAPATSTCSALLPRQRHARLRRLGLPRTIGRATR